MVARGPATSSAGAAAAPLLAGAIAAHNGASCGCSSPRQAAMGEPGAATRAAACITSSAIFATRACRGPSSHTARGRPRNHAMSCGSSRRPLVGRAGEGAAHCRRCRKRITSTRFEAGSRLSTTAVSAPRASPRSAGSACASASSRPASAAANAEAGARMPPPLDANPARAGTATPVVTTASRYANSRAAAARPAAAAAVSAARPIGGGGAGGAAPPALLAATAASARRLSARSCAAAAELAAAAAGGGGVSSAGRKAVSRRAPSVLKRTSSFASAGDGVTPGTASGKCGAALLTTNARYCSSSAASAGPAHDAPPQRQSPTTRMAPSSLQGRRTRSGVTTHRLRCCSGPRPAALPPARGSPAPGRRTPGRWRLGRDSALRATSPPSTASAAPQGTWPPRRASAPFPRAQGHRMPRSLPRLRCCCSARGDPGPAEGGPREPAPGTRARQAAWAAQAWRGAAAESLPRRPERPPPPPPPLVGRRLRRQRWGRSCRECQQ